MGTSGQVKCFMKRSVANKRKKVNSSDYKPVTLLLRETPIVRNHSTLLGSQYIGDWKVGSSLNETEGKNLWGVSAVKPWPLTLLFGVQVSGMASLPPIYIREF